MNAGNVQFFTPYTSTVPRVMFLHTLTINCTYNYISPHIGYLLYLQLHFFPTMTIYRTYHYISSNISHILYLQLFFFTHWPSIAHQTIFSHNSTINGTWKRIWTQFIDQIYVELYFFHAFRLLCAKLIFFKLRTFAVDKTTIFTLFKTIFQRR